MNQNQKAIEVVFLRTFGRTSLNQRLDDIVGEAIELQRFTDMQNLKEECGDLLASTMMLASECGWTVDELINATLDKIDRRQQQYKSLGRKVKVALLGGAFDPIHDGHIKLAQFVLNASKTFDEVWIVPANKHMHGKQMASTEHRLAMCELAAKVDGRIRVFPYEIENDLSGETFHFATRLLDENFAKDQYDFSMIIGQDNANSFDSWVNYEHLEKMMRFVVVAREGEEPNDANWYLKTPHIYLKDETNIPEISSSDIRDWLKVFQGEYNPSKHKCSPMSSVNAEVRKYIQEHTLYES